MAEAPKRLKLQQEDDTACIQEIIGNDDLTQDEIAACIPPLTNEAEDGDGMAEAAEKLKLQQEIAACIQEIIDNDGLTPDEIAARMQEVTNDAEDGDGMAEASEKREITQKDLAGYLRKTIKYDDIMVKAPEKSDLTEKEILEYKQAFKKCDLDCDGYIKRKELGSLMRSVGRVIPAKDVENIVHSVQIQDKINIDDFLKLMSLTKDNDLKSTFKMLDIRGDGYIRSNVLYEVVKALFGNTTKYEIKQMIQIADTDGDGKLSYEEFAAAVKEGLKLKDC